MRICMFSIVNYWHGIKGGMEIHGKLLSEGLARKGHPVSIISTRHPDRKEFEEKRGVAIYYLENTVFGSRRKNWKNASSLKFYELHKKQPFSVVLSQSFAAYGLPYLKKNALNIPLIPILHGCIQQELTSLRNNIPFGFGKTLFSLKAILQLIFSYFIEQKPLLSASDQILTVSQELIRDLKKWYGVQVANKSTTVCNGIDTVHFSQNLDQRDNIRSQYGIHDNEILLMTLGTLNKEKGHHLALEALAEIKRKIQNVKLMIVGTGDHRVILEKKIRDLNLDNNVILAGFVDHQDTVKYYNGSDIFLMPTLRVEGLPFVLLEAMSCCKPIVASRIGGNKSILRDGKNGFLIKPGDVKELTEKIQTIMSNGNLAESLSVSARQTIIDHFSVDQMIDKTIDLLEKAV
jgi:glycosyltransferase involved in cell wall biosynthesis